MIALADWPALFGFAFFGALGLLIGFVVGFILGPGEQP